MRQRQFNIAISGLPHYYAVFEVKQVPLMLRQVLTRGNLLYWNNFRAQLVRVKTSMCMQVDASDLDFVGYMTQPQMKEADK